MSGFDPSCDKTQLLISDADKELAFLELDDVALARFARSYLIECERAFTEGHDRAAGRGAEHESPTAVGGDAQNIGGPSQ